MTEVSDAVRQAQSYDLPIGWGSDRWPPFSDFWNGVIWLAGGLLTGLLTTLGAPFWFDLLTRLLALRGGGVRPPPAPADPTSATVARAARGSGQLALAGGPGTLEDQLSALLGPRPQRAPDPPQIAAQAPVTPPHHDRGRDLEEAARVASAPAASANRGYNNHGHERFVSQATSHSPSGSNRSTRCSMNARV